MSLARSRIEHLTLQRDHLFRVRRANSVSLRVARHELWKALQRSEREEQRGLVELLKTAVAAVEDALEAVD